jgi:hypothetical protein
MTTKLNKPDVAHFNNGDHVEFHVTSYDLFKKNESVIDASNLLTAYQAKVKQETNIFKWLRGSEYTERKAEVDHERGKVFTGMVGMVHSYEKHIDATLRDHAKHVARLIDNYGTLYEADYDAETAGIDSIIEKLQSNEYRTSTLALQLVPWITELTRLNDLFKTYVLDTEAETGKRPDISPKQARKETDDAMRNITSRIESMINLNGDYLFKTLVHDFNVHVDHYNTLVKEHYGRLHARHDIHGSIVETIADQYYTGKPINLIPTVQYRKKETDGTETLVDLVFTVDFTVRYEDNIGPGTAVLYIVGIGKYEGEITTTFNIGRV